jgi:hypothetical protein
MLMSWGMFPVSRHARLFIGCLAFPGVITVELYLTAHVPVRSLGWSNNLSRLHRNRYSVPLNRPAKARIKDLADRD